MLLVAYAMTDFALWLLVLINLQTTGSTSDLSHMLPEKVEIQHFYITYLSQYTIQMQFYGKRDA